MSRGLGSPSEFRSAYSIQVRRAGTNISDFHLSYIKYGNARQATYVRLKAEKKPVKNADRSIVDM